MRGVHRLSNVTWRAPPAPCWIRARVGTGGAAVRCPDGACGVRVPSSVRSAFAKKRAQPRCVPRSLFGCAWDQRQALPLWHHLTPGLAPRTAPHGSLLAGRCGCARWPCRTCAAGPPRRPSALLAAGAVPTPMDGSARPYPAPADSIPRPFGNGMSLASVPERLAAWYAPGQRRDGQQKRRRAAGQPQCAAAAGFAGRGRGADPFHVLTPPGTSVVGISALGSPVRAAAGVPGGRIRLSGSGRAPRGVRHACPGNVPLALDRPALHMGVDQQVHIETYRYRKRANVQQCLTVAKVDLYSPKWVLRTNSLAVSVYQDLSQRNSTAGFVPRACM